MLQDSKSYPNQKGQNHWSTNNICLSFAFRSMVYHSCYALINGFGFYPMVSAIGHVGFRTRVQECHWTQATLLINLLAQISRLLFYMFLIFLFFFSFIIIIFLWNVFNPFMLVLNGDIIYSQVLSNKILTNPVFKPLSLNENPCCLGYNIT